MGHDIINSSEIAPRPGLTWHAHSQVSSLLVPLRGEKVFVKLPESWWRQFPVDYIAGGWAYLLSCIK